VYKYIEDLYMEEKWHIVSYMC